jgi:flagellar hook-basal body complex protein FliE
MAKKDKTFPSHKKGDLYQGLNDLEIADVFSTSQFAFEENPFEEILSGFFNDKNFISRKKQTTQMFDDLHQAVLEMDEAERIFNAMMKVRERLVGVYQDLIEKTKI